MNRDFTPENFEDFLKQSADGFRLKAPERVWQNLSKELNKKRRRFFAGLSTLLLLTSAAGYYLIGHTAPEQKKTSPADKQPVASNQRVIETNTNTDNNALGHVAKVVSMQPKQKLFTTDFKAGKKEEKTLAPVVNISRHSQTGSQGEGLTTTDAASLQNGFTSTVVDSYIEQEGQAKTATFGNKPSVEKSADAFPLSIESVLNAYKRKHAAKRLETQLYFTPSVSYRKLTENKSYLRSLDPTLVAAGSLPLYSSVNSNVTHKPDVGFELGFATKYALSDHIKIRTGLQFNVNRYDVKAFSSPGSRATIWLNNGSGIDSLNTYTRYSNLSGYKSDWLQNLYFQVSMPIGIEYLFKGDEKLHFGIAATIQPTYVLGDRAYLITTDYKSYLEVPSLTRRWNVNTSLETFVGYKRWQFGPQVRYQLQSSFVSKYPVKENLFDFGLKVGLSLGKQ